jgi:hypothetical protein
MMLVVLLLEQRQPSWMKSNWQIFIHRLNCQPRLRIPMEKGGYITYSLTQVGGITYAGTQQVEIGPLMETSTGMLKKNWPGWLGLDEEATVLDQDAFTVLLKRTS